MDISNKYFAAAFSFLTLPFTAHALQSTETFHDSLYWKVIKQTSSVDPFTKKGGSAVCAIHDLNEQIFLMKIEDGKKNLLVLFSPFFLKDIIKHYSSDLSKIKAQLKTAKPGSFGMGGIYVHSMFTNKSGNAPVYTQRNSTGEQDTPTDYPDTINARDYEVARKYQRDVFCNYSLLQSDGNFSTDGTSTIYGCDKITFSFSEDSFMKMQEEAMQTGNSEYILRTTTFISSFRPEISFSPSHYTKGRHWDYIFGVTGISEAISKLNECNETI